MKWLKKDTYLTFPEMANKYVYFLKQGVVKIVTITEDGKEDIRALIKDGNIFGELALVGKENPNDFAVALENCLICFVDVPTMKRMMEENSALQTEVYKIMGFRIERLQRRLDSIIFKDSRTRILEFLDEYKKEFGKKDGSMITAKNILTHEEIAKLTATSRVTVTTVLNELKALNLIAYDTRKISFLSNKLLQ